MSLGPYSRRQKFCPVLTIKNVSHGLLYLLSAQMAFSEASMASTCEAAGQICTSCSLEFCACRCWHRLLCLRAAPRQRFVRFHGASPVKIANMP